MNTDERAGEIVYAREATIAMDEFIDVLVLSGLGARRPIDDPAIVADMIRHGNLHITARRDGKLVGFARTLTDFSYVGYLSDLAVVQSLQHSGIGKRLIAETRAQMGPRSMLVLLSAPAAVEYYPKLGFMNMPSAWLIRRGEPLG